MCIIHFKIKHIHCRCNFINIKVYIYIYIYIYIVYIYIYIVYIYIYIYIIYIYIYILYIYIYIYIYISYIISMHIILHSVYSAHTLEHLQPWFVRTTTNIALFDMKATALHYCVLRSYHIEIPSYLTETWCTLRIGVTYQTLS